MRMQEEGIPKEEYEFGELCRGRRYKRKNILRKESHVVSLRDENLAH
jgi:hypothetical protein